MNTASLARVLAIFIAFAFVSASNLPALGEEGAAQVEARQYAGDTSFSDTSHLLAFILGATAGTFAVLLVITFLKKSRTKPCVTMSAASKMVLHRGKWMSIEEYLSSQMGVNVSHAMTETDREEALRAFNKEVAENGIPRPTPTDPAKNAN